MKQIKNRNIVSLRGRVSAIKNKGTQALMALAIAVMTSPAFASSPTATGSGMPWEAPLATIQSSIQGPVARVFIIIAIIVTGLGMAFGEHGGGFKKIMGIAFGGSIVVGVVAFISSLFGAAF